MLISCFLFFALFLESVAAAERLEKLEFSKGLWCVLFYPVFVVFFTFFRVRFVFRCAATQREREREREAV